MAGFDHKAPAIELQGSSLISTEQDGEEVNVRQIFELLRAGKWTILACLLGAIVLGGLYWGLSTPTYEADGLVQVEDNSKTGSSSDLGQISSLLLGTPVETEAEIEILQSRLVLVPVIEKMNLLVWARPVHFPFIGPAIARFNDKLNATEGGKSTPSGAIWGFQSFAWGGEKIEVTSLDVPKGLLDTDLTLVAGEGGTYKLKGPDGDQLLSGKVGERAQSADGSVSLFVQELVARPGTKFRVTSQRMQTVLDRLLLSLTVAEQGKQSGVIQVKFKGASPKSVADFVNNLENAYIRQNVERRSADAQQSLEFLQNQLPDLKSKLEAAQAKLASYQQVHGAPDITSETQLLLQHSVDLETQRLQLAQQRNEALQRFTPQHPVVRALDDQLRTIEEAERQLKGRTETLPPTQQEVLSMLRDLDANTQLYTLMLNSMQELQIAKAGTIGNVRIIDHAIQPFRRYSPKGSIVLPLAAILGLFIGVAYVFVQRAMIRGVDDPAEVERYFGLSTYAAIPYSKAQRQLSRRMISGGQENFILASAESENVAVEALRSLRTSLHFAMLEAASNTIMLTGPSPGLGKSFVTVNLAAVLAQSGKRVIVIDADLRRGHLHRYISQEATPGLSDYIAGDGEISGFIKHSEIPGLDFVMRGTLPPNPAELLLHERFADLLKQLSSRYDYVIVDTPPVLAVTDAAIVGRLVGCTLLVLKSAQHPLREIEDVLKRLASSGVHVRGSLFNLVGERAGSYGYANYGYTYYQYDKKPT
jgi:tyrosine-protein kinase Etk/Wzc